MGLSSVIMKVAEACRPVLVRILPMSLLRRVKDALYERQVNQVKRETKGYKKGVYPTGINLIGCIRAEIGLGQSCRLVAGELKASGMEFTIKDMALDGSLRAEDHSFDAHIDERVQYDINLVHLEPVDLMMAYPELGSETWAHRYTIAFWLWELEEFPKRWRKAIDLVDEIWTPSEFASDSVRRVTNKPVYTIPYCVTAKTREGCNREYFHLPEDKFLFLAMYDTNSTMDRKNPIGVIQAFQEAFGPENQDVGLVLKMNNPRPEDLEAIQAMLPGYENIYCITEILDKDVVNSLIACVDVFVSLHRAEGFGLVMAEAMLNGTPCIATNWSSNTEFMNEKVACMVDYSMTVLEKDSPPYEKGAKWAEPEIGQAAKYMKQLATDPIYYQELSTKAKAYIQERLSMEQAVEKMVRRIEEIRGE